MRKILNFGHTVGHAIETLSFDTHTPLLHGEAVIYGILAESKISNLRGLISDKQMELIEQKLHELGYDLQISGYKYKEIYKNLK